MSQREACSGATFEVWGERLRFGIQEKRSWTLVEKVSMAAAIWKLDWRVIQSKGMSIYSPIEMAGILAGVVGGKPWAGRPRLAAVS